VTLEEYLQDYATRETKAEGEKLITRELAKFKDAKIKPLLEERLNKIRNTAQRDLYF
jgi:2-iminoacetate synthase